MDFKFEPISLDRQQEYTSRYGKCLQKASDYSFVNLWSWAEAYDLEWAWRNDMVWIRQNRPVPCFWAPVGDWRSADWPQEFPLEEGSNLSFIRVPEQLIQLWESVPGITMDMADTRGAWDYIYAVSELAELKGNRFHKKKNLVNQFKKKYPFTYRPFDKDMVQLAKDMQTDWCEWRDCEAHETLAAENRSIAKVLNHWNELDGLLGGAILVEGRMVCYTIAEPVSEETMVIHFEKGNPSFKGSYQAINQLFLAEHQDRFTWVNREQDLDDEGLRKAKLSYHPADFIKKSKVTVKAS